MEKWVIFGILAAVFFGATNLPQSIATTKTTGFEIIFFSGVASIIVGLIGWFFLAPNDIGFTRIEESGYAWSILAGFLLAIGSTFVLLAYQNGGNPATLPALFNINTIFALIFSLLLLSDARDAFLNSAGTIDWPRTSKVIIGALLVVIGGTLVAMNSQKPVIKKQLATDKTVIQHIR